jgi:hypothetical protein
MPFRGGELMSKNKSKRANKQVEKPSKNSGGKRRRLMVAATLIILIMAGGVLAQWTGVFSVPQKNSVKTGELVPAGLDPNTPAAKEYVYAGGKLIATEEPQGSGSTCTYSLSQSSGSFDNTGGPGTFNVIASISSCTWAATPNDSWITVTLGSTGTGNGMVNYTVAANSGVARTGSITAAGQTFTIFQSAPGGGGGEPVLA